MAATKESVEAWERRRSAMRVLALHQFSTAATQAEALDRAGLLKDAPEPEWRVRMQATSSGQVPMLVNDCRSIAVQGMTQAEAEICANALNGAARMAMMREFEQAGPLKP